MPKLHVTYIYIMWISESNEEWWVGYCYTLNSIIGAGILSIPWAYATSGWVLGILSQLIALFISLNSSFFVIATWSRIECLATLQESGAVITPVPFSHLFEETQYQYITSENDSVNLNGHKPHISTRKFDICEMTRISMGKNWGNAILIALSFNSYSVLCGYISIFATSLASNVPMFGSTCNLYDEEGFFNTCRIIYWGYLSIFSTIMIVLSWFHISEQKWMQICMMVFRLVAFSIMIITAAAALATNSQLEEEGENEADPATAEFSNFGRIFFIVVMASLFENTIPTTNSFVKNKGKHLPRILVMCCFTFCILYILLGMILSFGVGDLEEMATLNWRDYSAGTDDRPWWTYLISSLVVLLPAVDVSSAFPIVAGNLADNIMNYAYPIHKEGEITQVNYI